MSLIDNGGYAFPTDCQNDALGMMLRDWFAGHAMAGYLAAHSGDARLPSAKTAAKEAYEYADAMIAARYPKAVESAEVGGPWVEVGTLKPGDRFVSAKGDRYIVTNDVADEGAFEKEFTMVNLATGEARPYRNLTLVKAVTDAP